MAERPTITRTTHMLPSERLSPLDFERLCLWLVRREGFERAEHLGAAGGEQGRDIVAWRDGKRVVFQCKRVGRLSPGGAEAEIQKLKSLPAGSRPDVVVFLVSTSVGVKTRNRARAAWGDEKTCLFWAGSELDERVKRYADILQEFFDLGPAGLRRIEPAEEERALRFYSTYISYSRTDADRAFAFKLYERFRVEGVSVWLIDHDIKPGEVALDTVDRAIREAEKLLLCCSKTSLTSWWVNDELDKAIEKERSLWEGRRLVLIPLKLDDYLGRWESGKAAAVRSRYPADFSGWETDPARFEDQFQKVLRALKRQDPRDPPPMSRL